MKLAPFISNLLSSDEVFGKYYLIVYVEGGKYETSSRTKKGIYHNGNL